MEKSFANVSIYDARTNELLHFERVWSDFGPECAVHQEASTLYKFFAESQPVFSYVEAYCGDLFQQWKRHEDDICYKLTYSNAQFSNTKLDN